MNIESKLKDRFRVLFDTTNVIAKSASEDTYRAKEILQKFQDEVDEVKKQSYFKTVQSLQMMNTLKAKEVDTNIKIMNELYSLATEFNITLDLTDEEKEVVEFNMKMLVPTFIVNKKGEIEFLNEEVKRLYDILEEGIGKPDSEVIENIQKSNTILGNGTDEEK